MEDTNNLLKEQIIADQESIGNVEISLEIFNKLQGLGEFEIWGEEQSLFFAPREVVYPSCQKKKDNHSQQYHIAEPIVSDERSLTEKSQETRYRADEEPEAPAIVERTSGSDIPSSKIFEDVIDWINNWEVSKSTGDFMFINNKERLGEYPDEWLQDLKLKIKEKWGKIER